MAMIWEIIPKLLLLSLLLIPKISVKSRGLSWQLWLSRNASQAKATVRPWLWPGLAWPGPQLEAGPCTSLLVMGKVHLTYGWKWLSPPMFRWKYGTTLSGHVCFHLNVFNALAMQLVHLALQSSVILRSGGLCPLGQAWWAISHPPLANPASCNLCVPRKCHLKIYFWEVKHPTWQTAVDIKCTHMY